ncbi:MAG: hypothetical protein ACRD4X_12590 [Candidatus Acidiferrales bacterium]
MRQHHHVGHGTVKLHHIGLMFDPDASSPMNAITNVFTVASADMAREERQ